MPDAEFYSSLGTRYEDAFAHNAGLLSFMEAAIAYLPSNAHVLDAGCGTGKPVATSLAAAGHPVTGIDISDTMVELSRKAVPGGTFTVADMRNYVPPLSERFGAIFNILSLFALEREEIETIMMKWHSWLETGGLLCICTMAAEDCHPETKGQGYDADGRCAREIRVRFMGEQVKITLFTRNGWEMLLRANGFEVVDTRTELFFPPKEADNDEEPHYYIIARKAR
jgi:SAM-dependent methyltransferase